MQQKTDILSSFLKKIRLILVITLALIVFVCLVLLVKGCLFGRDAVELSSLMLGEEEANSITQHVLNPYTEVRGVWIASVANINFPSSPGLSESELKSELDEIISTLSSLGINSIYFQVRPSCDALYKSDIFPVSEWLSADGILVSDFDPLSYIITEAHKVGISIHAWINPLRVTYSSYDSKQEAIDSLHVDSPARKNPEWTVCYGGKLYFDPGIPEVRKLISDGIAEIVNNYDVDGIIFDDYFYPYPSNEFQFDDEATYLKYGTGFENIEDWRRNNVNLMIEQSYDTVKSIESLCQFGVAPFGIWQNNSSSSDGSQTKGLEAYSAIYCDALAWIRGGYIDYISPQIYWQFTNNAAAFDVLTRWWNEQLEESDVKLVISHAAYNSDAWNSETEIKNQVEFARNKRSYAGSIFYGYEAIYNNDCSLRDQISSLYKKEIIYTDIASDGSAVCITSPNSESSVSSDRIDIIGDSDPGLPLYYNGKAVGRTKSGEFVINVKLKYGKNTFVFSQNGIDYNYTINRYS